MYLWGVGVALQVVLLAQTVTASKCENNGAMMAETFKVGRM
jgi:hypothetical protein